MKRRWFAVLGAFLLVVNGALLVTFGFPTLDAEAALSLVAWLFVGVLFVLGGSSVQIGTIEWHQLVGAPMSSWESRSVSVSHRQH
jgi:hypothetical protein